MKTRKRWIIGGLAALLLAVAGVAVAQLPNTLNVSSAASGSAPAIRASGIDTNVSINLVPKGTGTVQVNGVPITGAGGGLNTTSLTVNPGPVTINGSIVATPGTSIVTDGLGGIVLTNTSTPTTTAAPATETDLLNFSVPANSLSATNQFLVLHFLIQNAATANAKQTRAYFGATLVCDSTSIATNNAWYDVTVWIYRTGAATQLAWCSSRLTGNANAWNASGGASTITQSTPAETLSGAVVLRVTGTDAVAAAGTTLREANLRWYPAGQ